MARQKLSHIFTKIALKPLHTNLFHIVFSAFFLTIGISKNYSQELNNQSIAIPAKKQIDSTSININDLTKIGDTIKSDTIKPKKAILEGKIKIQSRAVYQTRPEKKTHYALRQSRVVLPRYRIESRNYSFQL